VAALRRVAPRGSAGAPDAAFVYRQSESLFTYYDTYAAVSNNSALLGAATLVDPVSGRACGGGGLLAFANATFASYWSSTIGGEIAGEGEVDAVFFDGFDKLYGGDTLATLGCAGFTPALAAAALLAKVDATAAQARVLNAAGKVPILSTYNFLKAAAEGLSLGEGLPLGAGSLGDMNGVYEDDYVQRLAGTSWLRFYEVWLGHGAEQDALMIANALLEAQAGVPCVARSAVGSMHTLQYGAIGFLIVQRSGSYWGASSGWLDADWTWSGILDWIVGAPLAPAARTGTYTWSRAFAHANATIDTKAGRAALTFASGAVAEGFREAPPASPPVRSLPSTSWDRVPLFAHVRWANFSAEDLAGLSRFASVTVQVEPDAPLPCEAQAADVQSRLAAAGAETATLMYGNLYFAEPNCNYNILVAESPWLWLNDSSGAPYRPAGRYTFDLRNASAPAWWAAHVIGAANVSGGFGDGGCGHGVPWLNASQQAAFAAAQLATQAVATALVNATSGLYVANCPIVPAIGDNPLPGVDGEMIESWCSDFAPGSAGPATYCRDELVEAVVLAAAPRRTWLQARYYMNKENAYNPEFGLAAFLVAAAEGSFFGASRDWDWAGDWQNLLAWPWANRSLGAPTGPPTMSDPAGCAWSRAFANATASVNVCTKHLFARISWDGGDGGAPPPRAGDSNEPLLPVPAFANVDVAEAPMPGGGGCARGAARVRAPWAASGHACLAWRDARRGLARRSSAAQAAVVQDSE